MIVMTIVHVFQQALMTLENFPAREHFTDKSAVGIVSLEMSPQIAHNLAGFLATSKGAHKGKKSAVRTHVGIEVLLRQANFGASSFLAVILGHS